LNKDSSPGFKMKMDAKHFEENVLSYGADLDKWPEEIRQEGMESLKNASELQAVLADQGKFEKVLKSRKYEEPSGNLSQRIISLSLQLEQKSPSWLSLFFSKISVDEFFSHKPARIMASFLMISILVVGFFIGFSISPEPRISDERQAGLQEFLHYQGDALWTKR